MNHHVFRILAAIAFPCLICAAAEAQVKQFNGRYTAESDPNIFLLIEGVPWNDREQLTVITQGKELRAFRSSPQGAFLYNESGCAISFTPQRVRGKQIMIVEMADTCRGHLPLGGLTGSYLKQ